MFKESFKYYKSKCPPPSLDYVISLSDPLEKVTRLKCYEVSSDVENHIKDLGLKPSAQWQVFELKEHPGLIIIQNPFTQEGTHQWVRRCLSKYPGPPNKCNLHNHSLLNLDENWWDVCLKDKERKEILIKKLRWVTLGYHHDWDTKIYSESMKTEMPEELINLVSCIGKVVGNWDVIAEAAILNFYRIDSTLSGHTDHSEPNSEAPLFSISFGQSAIFLIGGKTVDDPTSAVFINNGDIMVMSGECRLCYHGVPKIIMTNYSDDKDVFSVYLKEARINLNIRQVLLPGQKCL